MATPAWKIAMQERKKLKEEEEKKKQAEREAYLASIPAWKRPMVLKKLEEDSKSKESNKPAETNPAPAPVDKWTQATKKLEQVKQKPEPRPAAVSTTTTPSTPSVPAWKVALQERKTVAEAKKKLAETEKEDHKSIESVVSPVRKALGGSQTIARVKEKFEKEAEVQKQESPIIIKKQLKHVQEPELRAPQKHESPVISIKLKHVEGGPPDLQMQTQNQSESPTFIKKQLPSSPLQKEPLATPWSEDIDNDNNTVIKHDTNSTSTSPSNVAPDIIKPSEQTSVNKAPPSSSTKSQVELLEENDPKFLAMPIWKQELMRRKRKQQQGTNSSESKAQNTKQSAPTTNKVDKKPATDNHLPNAINKPEIVNASNKSDSKDSPKLVKKEGTTLRAPVIKTASKWADITEDDPEFQKLPPWKQTVIRRRREDERRRTAPAEQPVAKEEKKKEPVSTPWSRELNKQNSPGVHKQENIEEKTVEQPIKKQPDNIKSVKDDTVPTPTTGGVGKVQALLGQFSGGQVKRKVPPPAKKANETEVTLIDEISSDEDEAKPVKTLKASQSTSILKSPLKPQKRGLRRVSWSDTNIAVEHYYPKYDYSDYDEIEQPQLNGIEEANDSKTDSSNSDANIATPIHPWLSPSKPSPSSMGGAGGSIHSFLPSAGGLGSVGSFMSMYTLNSTSAPTKDTTPSYSTNQKEEEVNNDNPPETYANLDSDTAALLF